MMRLVAVAGNSCLTIRSLIVLKKISLPLINKLSRALLTWEQVSLEAGKALHQPHFLKLMNPRQ